MTGPELRSARERLGLSQTALADRLGLGAGARKTVFRWESGAFPVPGPVALAVAAMVPASA
jgi:transcriptional regulator with XRE-family HTH domain